MLVKEATRLGHHSAFVVPRTKLFFDEVDVPDDVILVDEYRVFFVVIREDIPHLRGVIPNSTWGIVFGTEVFCGFEQ